MATMRAFAKVARRSVSAAPQQSFLETLGKAAEAAPGLLEQPGRVFERGPALLNESAAALGVPGNLLPTPPTASPRAGDGGMQGGAIEDAGKRFLGATAITQLETLNEIMAGLGMQIKVVYPSCPDGQVDISVIKPSGQPSGLFGLGTSPIMSMTPRQFTKAMNEATEAGRMAGLNAYVNEILSEERIPRLRFIPRALHRKLYYDIGRIIVFAFQQTFLSLDDASVWGHTLKVVARPSADSSGKLWEEGTRRRAGTRSFIHDKQLQLVVDDMLKNKAVHIPMMPREAQRQLYVNCIHFMFNVVDDLICRDAQQVTVMGHKLAFFLEPQDDADVYRWDSASMSYCSINEDVICEFVDELLACQNTNIAWLPDVFESQLYKGAIRLLLRVAEHAIGRLRVNVLGREVKMSLTSSVDEEANNASEKRSRSLARTEQDEGTTYYAEVNPLELVSTTELETRLKDLTEQLRLLRILKDFGHTRLDLTADTPKFKRVSEDKREATSEEAAGAGNEGDLGATGTITVGEADPDKAHEFQTLAHTLKLGRTLSVKCEVATAMDVPYGIISDLGTYGSWMPWCTSGQMTKHEPPPGREAPTAPGFPESQHGEEKVSSGEVTFGFETGTFLGTVGDTVKYRITVWPPTPSAGGGEAVQGCRVIADASNGFRYGEKLIYDWRFYRISEKKTKVELDMLFQASSVLYMPLWDSMQNMVINNLFSAFIARSENLQKQLDATPKKAPIDAAKPAAAPTATASTGSAGDKQAP
eukprot:TRINITY_DN15459_c0_g1_i1.p1 TRINITY_DN15459_c0_g1~~TRINITY_DN15459_c0_g1_i1.p1  ORF type:complete len:758 (+),score=207.74 TRINITY_DN15459_c0_g1_i1:149-2422(+)